MLGSRRITPLRAILLNSLKHIEDLDRAIDDLYGQEFQDLKQFSESLKCHNDYACSEGEKEVNRKKNRYKDILPFNVSRVVLREVSDVVGSNYVNANYIRGASGSPAYIASQGPLPNTVNDFWRMVVECEVQVIVMACNAEESGKHKCENYWIEREGEERSFGSIEIRLLKAKVICPDFLVRTMRIRYTNDKDLTEERTICQFHYSAWPDHGVPPLVRPLLDMVRLVRDTQASETLPVLVHCSAGCGRTGTICAIDFVWGLLRLGKLREDFSLYNLVRDMRKQRVAMVQTKEQYVLVHHAVRELFKEQLQLIDSHTYANVDLIVGQTRFNDEVEPIYETLCIVNSYCDEKQDQNKLDEMNETKHNFGSLTAPPLPKKKCAAPAYSKQEKEVENLSEKNRIISLKSIDNVDGLPINNSIRRPKIAKLLALFERTSAHGERTSSKVKSHTVSRSHSLGPIRKPLLTEVIPSRTEEKKQRVTTEPPIRSGGKLKLPKLIATTTVITRPVPHVKRSKSLKVAKDSTPLLKLLQYASADELVDETPGRSGDELVPTPTESDRKSKTHASPETDERFSSSQDSHRRRRSLESLMGEEAPEITWPTTVRRVEKAEKLVAQRQTTEVNKSKTGLSFRQQFQMLTNASQKRMSSLASGLGIRERRNSFRQAVSKEDGHERITGFGSEGRFVSVPEDAAAVLVDGSKGYRETLTVKSQNGEILRGGYNVDYTGREVVSRQHSQPLIHHSFESQNHSEFKESRSIPHSLRLSSKNRFLSKLKSELQTHNHVTDREVSQEKTPEERFVKLEDVSSLSHDSAMKIQVRSEKISKSDTKSRGSYFIGTKTFKRTTQSGNMETVNDDLEQKLYNSGISASRPQGSTTLKMPLSPPLSHQRVGRTEKPRRKTQPYVSSDDLYVGVHGRGTVDASRTVKPSVASPISSLSSDNLSDYVRSKKAPRSSDEVILRDSELSRRNLERLRSLIDRSKQDYGSESSSSSGARELHAVMRFKAADFESQQGKTPWLPPGRSKSTPQAGEFLKPTAPPRVRRRGSEIVSRYSLHDPLEGQIPVWSLPRTQSNDARYWNGAIGVDLDAVAASIQMQREGVQNISNAIDGAVSAELEQQSTVNHTAARKHQYL